MMHSLTLERLHDAQLLMSLLCRAFITLDEEPLHVEGPGIPQHFPTISLQQFGAYPACHLQDGSVDYGMILQTEN